MFGAGRGTLFYFRRNIMKMIRKEFDTSVVGFDSPTADFLYNTEILLIHDAVEFGVMEEKNVLEK